VSAEDTGELVLTCAKCLKAVGPSVQVRTILGAAPPALPKPGHLISWHSACCDKHLRLLADVATGRGLLLCGACSRPQRWVVVTVDLGPNPVCSCCGEPVGPPAPDQN
jgi:hypothetical protein